MHGKNRHTCTSQIFNEYAFSIVYIINYCHLLVPHVFLWCLFIFSPIFTSYNTVLEQEYCMTAEEEKTQKTIASKALEKQLV